MDFEGTFPLRIWTNQGIREDRRVEMEARLEEVGVTAERFAAVRDKRQKRAGSPAVDENVRCHILHNLTFRLALRKFLRTGLSAVLVLADDVSFHPNFKRLISSVDLPNDWGIFLLGCTHLEAPEWVSVRVVRVSQSIHSHAVAVKAEYVPLLMQALRRSRRSGTPIGEIISSLSHDIPVYAAYPNLAWQQPPPTNSENNRPPHYTRDGKQRSQLHAVSGLLGTLVGSKKQSPKLGLLFLVREDVNLPQIWREFAEEALDRIRIFSHIKFPDRSKGRFLRGTRIKEWHHTEWGELSLVKASRALLLAALEDSSLTHFVLLSESCIPIRPLPEILRKLELDPRPQFRFWPLQQALERQLNRAISSPSIPDHCWRFSHQWWLLDRVAARIVSGVDYTGIFTSVEVPDEAYFGTVLAMQGYPLDGEVINRSVTWTHWEEKAGSPTSWDEVPEERLHQMLNSNALFARKFSTSSSVGKFGLHRSPHLYSR